MNKKAAGFALTPRGLFLATLVLGVLLRGLPLFDLHGRLLQQWPTEDGYLTLTIARNIALGRGFSVAAGTVLTNGTQPLVTSIYSVGFWLFDASTTASLFFVQSLQIAFGVVACVLLRRFCLSWFEKLPYAEWIASISVALWFLGPVLIRHSMNCLETTLVIVLQLLVLLRWYGPAGSPTKMAVSSSWSALLATSLLMGLLAWSRVDNAFFLFGLALVHLLVNGRRGRLSRALFDVCVMGGVTAICIFPWLLFGKLQFGHWVPISGISEGRFSRFGQNAGLLPSILLEYVIPIFGLPTSLEALVPVTVACCLLLVGWAATVSGLLRGRELAEAAPVYLLGWLGVLYGFYYGFMFGAGYFLTRYLAPLATLTIPIFSWLLLAKLQNRRTLAYLAGGSIAAVLIVQQVRLYFKESRHPHFQVVQWTKRHVPDDVWLGAIQTGTLGFYHDKTINFDGKVDPRALQARLADRHHEFIVNSPVQAIVDWTYINSLLSRGPLISEAFYPLLVDKEQNISVLIRKGGALDHQKTPAPSAP
jgi:hypothetical protein